ncbi:hypothetical protein B0T26DRAFT_793670 [Lasiosphaeria miniovina]|uniref:Uncharacterized protein n=1 Tax=Lasiosphaeria miniovina TaxID=1954250 RepID=A0AA40DHF8_9PEZI|nr:uncharacterized protein B0T26DRAFT_793670 [Lasiosphaeria miniovina]KAK0703684.1 hypothetical protein B0T26DRAFT_793670 [Lasiosphaeria miniovina]
MTSSSNEVCELWNGQGLVRALGEAPIREFICLTPRAEPDLELPPKMKELREAQDDGYLEECDLREYTQPGKKANATKSPLFHRMTASPPDFNDDYSTSSDASRRCIIIRNTDSAAPNLSLNIRNRAGIGEHIAIVVAAALIQLGVVFYAGFATYYPTMGYPKDGLAVAGYAFPCVVTGIFMLVVGMFTSAHVVDSGTVEKAYKVKINDQSFGSFALYPPEPRSLILTSIRAPPDVKLKAKTVAATLVALCGFFIQFVGLRGSHWSIFVAQLGATIMVGLRAWMRRAAYAAKPCRLALPRGYEMDWLATTFDSLAGAPWRNGLTRLTPWSRLNHG